MDDGFKKLLITIGVFIVIALFFTLIRFVKSNDKYKNQIKKGYFSDKKTNKQT